MKRVAVQIGHYPNAGAPGEVETCLLVVPQIEGRLRAAGLTVEHFDEGLWAEPPSMHRDFDVAVFVHCDSAGANSTGFSIGYWEEKHPGSSKLAAVVRDVYATRTGLKFLGYNITRGEERYYGNLRFVRDCRCILVELGCVSNLRERTWLQANAQAVGYAVADGIIKFLGARRPREKTKRGRTSVLEIKKGKKKLVPAGGCDQSWISIAPEFDKNFSVQLSAYTSEGKEVVGKTHDRTEAKNSTIRFSTRDYIGDASDVQIGIKALTCDLVVRAENIWEV